MMSMKWWTLLGLQQVLSQVAPAERSCPLAGLYFDATTLQCKSCSDIDSRAELVSQQENPILARSLERLGSNQCRCANGLVQCYAGDRCSATVGNSSDPSSDTFVAQGPFQCGTCPTVNGMQTAPTQDRSQCLPCLVDSSASSTSGYSESLGDCLCPDGSALVERNQDGTYLEAKKCVKCSEGLLESSSEPLRAYGCSPCPDPERMYRASDGTCICRQPDFDAAGGACVSLDEVKEVRSKFQEAAWVSVEYRDIIDGLESWWRAGPFGQFLGIEARTSSTFEVLKLDAQGAQDITVTSAAMKWLYMRCAVGCTRGNATACQCVSNLCVLQLYDYQAAVCTFVQDLYQTRPEGSMPQLYYAPQRPSQTLTNAALNWRLSFADVLVFWLASYSLEGSWLGWQRLESQLDPCSRAGTSTKPRSLPSAWRRFGSSLRSECNILASSVLECGRQPVFYDLFVENTDGSLVPVPVRILNIVTQSGRPNLNLGDADNTNDILVHRFLMCDAVSGRESGPGGAGEAYLDGTGYLRVIRWAAHLAVQVQVRPEGEGQIYVPVVSIAYAEKRADNLQEGITSLPGSFAAEYSMDASGYWTAVIVLFVFILLFMLALMVLRLCLFRSRYPNVLVYPDPHLFAPRIIPQLLIVFSTCCSTLFWFQYVMTLFWLIMFKGQNVPLLLLPTALGVGQYEAHDVMLVMVFCFAILTVFLGLWKQLRVFFFLVDWEKPREASDSTAVEPPPLPVNPPPPAPPGTLVGSPLLGGSYPGLQGAVQGTPPTEITAPEAVPDSGISAWRSLFVCNELNERLTATRAVPEITWLSMLALLDGCEWSNAARWTTHADRQSALAAEFNPFLQFSLGISVWIFILVCQFLLQRIASIFTGHDLNDFIDVCSIANISVFILDEPFHGYYIHGKAPSSRGDWGHTELERVLHDEDKGIGFSRGLSPDGCQTFEMFLPPDTAVQLSNGNVAHFRQELGKVFMDVQMTQDTVARRDPPKPTSQDVAQMSQHRCNVQALVDAMVNAVMRGANEVLQMRTSFSWFWGTSPNVLTLQHPIFYKDQDGISYPNGLGWSSSLAYGSELRIAGIGIPLGFEWHLGLLELLTFSLIWRFQGSIGLASALAYALNRSVLYIYGAWAKARLAHTAIINGMFLI